MCSLCLYTNLKLFCDRYLKKKNPQTNRFYEAYTKASQFIQLLIQHWRTFCILKWNTVVANFKQNMRYDEATRNWFGWWYKRASKLWRFSTPVGTSSSRSTVAKNKFACHKDKKKISPLLLPDLHIPICLRMRDTIRLTTEHSIQQDCVVLFHAEYLIYSCACIHMRILRCASILNVMESLFLEWQSNNHLLLYCLAGTSYLYADRQIDDSPAIRLWRIAKKMYV